MSVQGVLVSVQGGSSECTGGSSEYTGGFSSECTGVLMGMYVPSVYIIS